MNWRKSDLVIVGGGMVGLAMAASLAPTFAAQNRSIVVVEKSDLSQLERLLVADTAISSQDYQMRVSAISPGNQRLLTQLNAWQKLPLTRRADYDQMIVWDADGSGKVQFDAAEFGIPHLGSIVENDALRAALYQSLKSTSNIKIIQGVGIDSILGEIETSAIGQIAVEKRIEILLTDGEVYTPRLLIGADGAFSSVRSLMEIGLNQSSYEQTAFVANVETESAHNNTAWQRFTSNGPVAFLPLPKPNLCSVVWSLDNKKAKDIESLKSSEQFAEYLERAFGSHLGKVSAVSHFAGFPLFKRHANQYLARRCALIGDAAHTIHPLAGQGVNLGFQDVECLSKVISDLIVQGRDIGNIANLRRFERERRAENTLMQESMSGFKWLFGNQSMPITLLRNMFMPVFDRSGPIKQQILKHAMGI